MDSGGSSQTTLSPTPVFFCTPLPPLTLKPSPTAYATLSGYKHHLYRLVLNPVSFFPRPAKMLQFAILMT